MAVLIIGTLDTKGREVAFARDLLRARGHSTIVADAGTLGAPRCPADVTREALFLAGGYELSELASAEDRGRAVNAAAAGATAIALRLWNEGMVDGVLGLGGSAGTTIGTSAMRALPFGVPKVMVSTLASGQTRAFVGSSDIAMFHSVADIAGVNRLTRMVVGNAAHALAGMVEHRPKLLEMARMDRPVAAATMFGVTTPCVDRARTTLDAAGFEVLVFHATGVGGQSMENLIRDGQVSAVFDLTTTEMADEVVGGVLSAGPDRLRAAGLAGIPQVVSVGAVDMVNFGPMETVPPEFRERKLHVHNAAVTLMRTTPAENTEIGRRIAAALGVATGPTHLVLPLGGVSALDAPGKPFYDPTADKALFDSLRAELRDHPNVRVHERAEHINDAAFADFAAELLIESSRNRLARGNDE